MHVVIYVIYVSKYIYIYIYVTVYTLYMHITMLARGASEAAGLGCRGRGLSGPLGGERRLQSLTDVLRCT